MNCRTRLPAQARGEGGTEGLAGKEAVYLQQQEEGQVSVSRSPYGFDTGS